jgi:hypothetical protein
MREVHTDPDGSKRLSVHRRAKILRHNLFGVDIDPQAVEITMMSLSLKALEGERSQLPPKQHLLPELKYNIMCGNSLIGPDIYDQGVLFADEERDRINAFDWYFVPVGASGARPRRERPNAVRPYEVRRASERGRLIFRVQCPRMTNARYLGWHDEALRRWSTESSDALCVISRRSSAPAIVTVPFATLIPVSVSARTGSSIAPTAGKLATTGARTRFRPRGSSDAPAREQRLPAQTPEWLP